MKKLTIVLLAFLFVGLGNVVAQTEVATDTKTEEVKKECPFSKTEDGKIICTKTGKECSKEDIAKCSKGAKKSCCKSKRKGCSGKYNKASKNYSSGGNSGFNFSKKSNCSKAVKECGEDCTKPCCAEEESLDSDEDSNIDE